MRSENVREPRRPTPSTPAGSVGLPVHILAKVHGAELVPTCPGLTPPLLPRLSIPILKDSAAAAVAREADGAEADGETGRIAASSWVASPSRGCVSPYECTFPVCPAETEDFSP